VSTNVDSLFLYTQGGQVFRITVDNSKSFATNGMMTLYSSEPTYISEDVPAYNPLLMPILGPSIQLSSKEYLITSQVSGVRVGGYIYQLHMDTFCPDNTCNNDINAVACGSSSTETEVDWIVKACLASVYVASLLVAMFFCIKFQPNIVVRHSKLLSVSV